MTKRLVRIQRIIEDAENEGLDLDRIFVDPDDLVELEEEAEAE